MSEDEGREPLTDDLSGLAARQAALRALAQAQPQESAAPTTPHTASALPRLPGAPARRGSAHRWIISALSVLAVAVVVAVVVANIVGGSRPSTANAKPMLRIVPASANMACSSQVAWSADGKRVAVLGNLNDCGGSQADSQTGVVFIYDAANGKLLQQAHPDQVIFRDNTVGDWVAKNTTPTSAAASLMYMSLTWTPDGQSVLLYFGIFADNPSSNGGAATSGLLRLGLGSDALTKVWLDHYLGMQSGDFERWDLTTGTSVQESMPPAATAYRWGDGGALIPTSGPSDGAVGAVDGGKFFSAWQSGNLSNPSFQSSPQATPVTTYSEVIWSAQLNPISPDGRYYYSYFPALVALTPPSTSFTQPGAQRAAPHDKALLTLAQRMTQPSAASSSSGATTMATTPLIAYRPDGRLLAEVSFNAVNDPNRVTPATFTISLYNTETGALVKRLTPSFTGLQAGNGGQEVLAWSPDGSRLLLSDNAYGAITIWGPGALPV